MTPLEQLAFFEAQARDAVEYARAQAAGGDPYALFNWSSAAKSHFMRALIGWRTGLLDPKPDLAAAVEASEAAIQFMRTTDVGLNRLLFEPIPGAYSAILVGRPRSEAIAEGMRNLAPSSGKITRDAIAESWLVSGLAGGDLGDGPSIAEELARAKRSALWGQTLRLYFQLLQVPGDDGPKAWSLTQQLVELFSQRRRSGYISAGPEYYGGDLDNEIVIDFHLAAIWHVRRWDLAGLAEAERAHVVPPAA
ncbi:MAG: hypothetical protein FIA92_06765 [Chloroflexi bacterium]|nr:hypothetical protein [Chloroflexota bacterium]